MFIKVEFTRKAEIPDFQPAQQASRQAAAEYAGNPFDHDTIGVSLPGVSADESFMVGNENNEIQGIAGNHPAFSDASGMPGAAFTDFGLESEDVGLNQGDHAELYDSDGIPFFSDLPAYAVARNDSMAGLSGKPVLARYGL